MTDLRKDLDDIRESVLRLECLALQALSARDMYHIRVIELEAALKQIYALPYMNIKALVRTVMPDIDPYYLKDGIDNDRSNQDP